MKQEIDVSALCIFVITFASVTHSMLFCMAYLMHPKHVTTNVEKYI
jgi:hypothetical protein